jgi:protein YibB
MSDMVTIVTAFMDIGRSHWEGEKNNQLIPNYIKRDTDTYFERFERLTKVKNPIVVFAHSKDFERLQKIRDDLHLVAIDTVFEDHAHLIKSIEAVQNEPSFIKFVENPASPEYWSPQYVAINLMKSFFVNYAVEQKLADSDTYAWIDFGYVRDDTFCPPGLEWKFDTEGKINLFAINPYTHNKPIFEIVRTGEVFIQGCHIVAPKAEWLILKDLVVTNLTKLLGVGLIDDDQTLLLMAYRTMPDKFKINNVNPSDWFVIFKDFNHVSN